MKNKDDKYYEELNKATFDKIDRDYEVMVKSIKWVGIFLMGLGLSIMVSSFVLPSNCFIEGFSVLGLGGWLYIAGRFLKEDD